MTLKGLSLYFLKKPVHVVGGAVRDRLLNRPTLDLDLVVPHGAKAQAKRLEKSLGGKAFVLDSERAVYRVTVLEQKNQPAYQIDISDWQGITFEEDIDRRDFTVNALAVPLIEWDKPSWSTHLIDRHNGLRDIKEKIIRHIRPVVFKEDPLRLLRAFRLAAELRFSIDETTLKTIQKFSALLKKPAPERIREEMLKLFSTKHSHSSLLTMEKTGLLEVLLPEIKAMRKIGKVYYGTGGVLKHTLDAVHHFESIRENLRDWFPKSHAGVEADLNVLISGYPREAHIKWALLLHDIGKPETAAVREGRLRFFDHEYKGGNRVKKMAKRFRWSNEETERYSKLVRHHMRPGNLANHPGASDKAFHRFFRDLGDDAVSQLILSLADHLTYLTPSQLKRRKSSHEKLTILLIDKYFHQKEKVLPEKIVNGYDVMKAFKLKPSPMIGLMLKDVTEAQVERKVHTKDEALAFLKKNLPRYKN